MAFDLYSIVIYPIIYIFPAYAANGAPVLFGRESLPLDFKRTFRGKRVFGDNKTIRGTAGGIIMGLLAGSVEAMIFGMPYLIPISLMLSVGAMFGDLLGSFIKRQMGIKSGSGVPILDQYGFFVSALVFAFWLGNAPNVYGLAFLVVLTGLLHVLTNRGAHRLRLKKVPW